MRFTAIDLELNQPSNRIIQIGACTVDTDQGILSNFSIYVDPEEEMGWNHVLNTGQTLQELLPLGFVSEWKKNSFLSKEAMTMFWDWHKQQQCGKKFIQWGRGDMRLLLGESQGCGYPSHTKTFDAKMAYKFIWQPGARLEKQSSLEKACENLQVAGPRRAHCALEDARATARVFLKMFKQVEALKVFQDKLK